MHYTKLAIYVAATICALSLAACVTSTGRQAAQPAGASVVVTTPAPPPHTTVVAAQTVVHEELIPDHNDVYIEAAHNNDIVYIGGSTYIWVVGADGRRHRHFYARGDRRQEIYRRRDNLRSVAPHAHRHPAVHYAPADGRHDAPHHVQQLHAENAHAHGHRPERHAAATDHGHRPDAPHRS